MDKHAPAFAKAKAERMYLEEFRKSKKALLMQQHGEKPIGAQEREAYAHADYIGPPWPRCGGARWLVPR